MHDRVVPRSRLTQLLNGRFTHRVTTVVGAAGYGKTTALALAVENNRLDPIGRDVWVSAVAADAEPGHLMNGIASALDVAPTGDDDLTRSRVLDAIWSAAPDDVALIVDDAHLVAGTPAVQVLQSLVADMPTNGHLVVGSRLPLELSLARLRAHGHLLEIDESTLSLDDQEIEALLQRETASGLAKDAPLPRHVATADLQLAAGVDAGADFVWEEILSGLDSDRLLHLRRAAVLGELDSELIDAITDGAFDAATLFAGIPLVDRFENDARRMHAILREALLSRLEPGEKRKTLAIAADAERARQRFAVAAELFHQSGDDIAALDSARDYVLTPIVFQSIEATTTTKRIADRIDPDSPTAKALDAISRYGGLEHQLIPYFEAAARSARERGDIELEVAALNRIMQALLLDHQYNHEWLLQRIADLAPVSDTAASVAAHFRSITCQLVGDAEGSRRELENLGNLGASREMVTRSSRLCDLGRPEEVAVGFGPAEIADLPSGAELFVGLAMWQRGEAEPEIANALATSMISGVLRRGFTHPSTSTLAVGTIIALASGEPALAARRVAHAVELSAAGVGASVVELVQIARAAVAAVQIGDDAALEILDEIEEPVGLFWPTRGQLFSLPLVYLCRPNFRDVLDSCEFGPSLMTAMQAGRALVQLREHGDATPAAGLPWTQLNLLRAHLLPTHLIELSCAAISAGNDVARDALDALPGVPDLLDRVVAVSTRPAVDVAQTVLGTISRAEPFTLHADVLGPIQLRRDGVIVETGAFVKRPKVRELFALLLERNTMQRHEICETLWPEHEDEDKALSSLRTTLSSLNDALEPDRVRGAAAFHLRIDGDSVTLDRRVTTDLERFEEFLESAQADDNAGLPARALESYRSGADLYRGEYLHGVDSGWVVLSRLRIQTLAGSAMCRVAELTAAKGEPEEAARWAARARQIDPLNERAGRLFATSLLASDGRSAARSAVSDLLSALADAGLTPETATTRLGVRLD